MILPGPRVIYEFGDIIPFDSASVFAIDFSLLPSHRNRDTALPSFMISFLKDSTYLVTLARSFTMYLYLKGREKEFTVTKFLK